MAANVQSLIQHWKAFDLPNFQRELDVAATEIANRQDESESSRKKLVEFSRDFKKSTPEDVRKIVAPILKSFQSEIDSLTKRSKAAEGAFLNVFKRIIDVPDPLPVFEYCQCVQQKLQRLQDLEIENKHLRETLNDYNEEFKEVKNQEVTIKQLKEKLKEYEEKVESTASARAKEKEKELLRRFSEQERQLQENHSIISKKFGEAEQKVGILQNSLENTQSELFDLKAKYDEEIYAKSNEMEMVLNDLERANQRAALAEKEITQLKDQLFASSHSNATVQKVSDSERTSDIFSRSSLEMELSAKEQEIVHLLEKIHNLQSAISEAKETEIKYLKLEEMLEEKRKVIVNLEEKLIKQKDYDEIQRELGILKSIEFSGIIESDQVRSSKPLEVLLLEKMKLLQSENTSLKVSNSDITARYDSLSKEFHGVSKTVLQQKDLIGQLEQDLANVNALSPRYRGEGEGQATSNSPSEIIAEATKELTTFSVPSSPVLKDYGNAAESLLPIISSQRERFRIQNQELEAQNLKLQHQLHLAEGEVERFRSDNIKLYEKIKFLQGYRTQRSTKYDDMESRYSSEYEEHLDPFTSFSKKEYQRKYLNLSPFEKITLTMGRTILSSKVARTITFVYSLLLHMLVFLVLYKLAYTESCKRDMASECAAKFAEHMNVYHDKNLTSKLN